MQRSNVEEIKSRLPIEEVIGAYVKLERSGKSLKAKCPFHHEKTASFYVSPDRGGYYCFGCGAKGDIFSFVEQFEGLDFKGALKVLADKAGVELSYDRNEKSDTERDRLFAVMEEAAKQFEAGLAASKEAQEYLAKRGLSEATRKEFRIGFAPEGWRNLYDKLIAATWPTDIIVKAGLAKEAEDKPGTIYDRFRGRIMFPISDSSGRVIAFTGRILPRLDDGKAAKYLNSPDTPIFDKSSVLYALDKAKSYVRRLNYSILVEGQMDLIMSHQAGVRNTVASSGTALTDAESSRDGVVNNLGLLRRLSNNVIIAFDSDAAGRKAAMRAANIALSLGMDVKIADIQGGKDPADLVLNNPEDWKNALRGAKPVVEFELGSVIADTPDPRKVPKAIRDRVFPFLAVVESETDRAYFIKLIGDKANLPEAAIRDDLKSFIARSASEAEKGAASARAFGGRGGREGREAGAEPAGSDAGRAGAAPFGASNAVRRIDLVERRMFGLLDLMERSSHPSAAGFAADIRKIAGDAFDARNARAKAMSSDIAFEAEAIFGAEPDRWDPFMRDLIANFERDLVGDELLAVMNELRTAEKGGDKPRVDELTTRFNALSIRKARIDKNNR